MPVIRITDELYEKLEALAVGFDNPNSVIERLVKNSVVENSVKKMKKLDVKPEKQQESTPINQSRRRTTEEVVRQIYPLAKRVFEGECRLNEAGECLVEDAGMNATSATHYLTCFQKMMNGERYKMCVNSTAVEYFLTKIGEDFGQEYLVLALSSLKQHIEYQKQFGNESNQIREIYEEFLPGL